ncbi:MAG: anaerobic sulfatase maturase [Anaerolineales bacterium]
MPGTAPIPAAFSLLIKPAGAACNLACEYCFYLGRQQLYPGSRLRMPDEVLQAAIRQMLDGGPGREVCLAWQGGEPTLMGLDFFERSVELVNKYKTPGQRVTYSFQTNGVLLDEEWCAFFKQHDFLVGLSLDGPAEMHNRYRVDKGGQGSFARVRRAWDRLQKHHVDTNILCALHAANISRPLEVYRFFRDELRATFIQFIPVVERLASPGNPVSQRSLKPGQYGAFLIEVFDEWVRRDVGTVFIQTFDSALASWCRLPASLCIFQEVCGSALVLEHNGDLYSCDHFVGPEHRLGNILDSPMAELAGSSVQGRFGLEKRDRLPACCRACEVRFACQGECPRNRFMQTPGGEAGLNYLCGDYRLFFQHVAAPMSSMAALLQMGRAPAEIMKM